VVDGISRETKDGPSRKVAEDKNPGRHEDRLAPLGAFAGNTRESQCHRCKRGQHHRRHHENPRAYEPAQLAKLSTCPEIMPPIK